MPTRFQLRTLRVTGTNVEPAELTFRPGLNTITGPSDTGKSYVLQCISYMLGSTTPPKEIDQSEGYSDVWLEFETSKRQWFTLCRSLRGGGRVKLFRGPLSAVKELEPEELLAKKSRSKTKAVSTFLAESCDLDGVEILAGKEERKKRGLSFADLRKFFVVDEVRIISETTPVRPSGQHTDRTPEDTTFDYLISGQDYSAIEPKEAALKVRVADWTARAEVLDKLIAVQRETLDGSPTGRSLEDQSVRLRDYIGSLATALREIGSQVERLQAQKRQILLGRRDLQARLDVVAQLQSRFTILDQSYSSDLERLDFIAESSHLADQIGANFCGVCGADLARVPDNTAHDHSVPQLQAIEAEKTKILGLRADLQATMRELATEHTGIDEHITGIEAEAGRIDEVVAAAWQPQLVEQQQEYEQAHGSLRHVEKLLGSQRYLALLEEERAQLGERPRRRRKGEPKPDTTIPIPLVARRQFANRMQSLLEEWAVPDAGVVEFEDVKMEVIVNGRRIGSHGKGVRALMRSAFTVALVRHCMGKKLGHPGLAVLDSPLTSYRGKDRYSASEDVRTKFYGDLAGDVAGQVIIIDNEKPPESLSLGHFVHFTRDRQYGRYGFFPL